MTDDIHKELRQSLPGADRRRLDYTRKAYRILPPVPEGHILDAGCGEGKPAMVLAEICDADITALDIDPESLRKLQAKAIEAGLTHRIHPVRGSLLSMPFADAAFNVIWAEATLHIVGVEPGLALWRRYLKPGGFIVIHECIWLRENPPKKAADYWTSWFGGIRTADRFADALAAAGFDVLEYFKLPDDLWWDDYFHPLELKINDLRVRYASDRQALEELDKANVEVEMQSKYSAWFGSGFFIAQKSQTG